MNNRARLLLGGAAVVGLGVVGGLAAANSARARSNGAVLPPVAPLIGPDLTGLTAQRDALANDVATLMAQIVQAQQQQAGLRAQLTALTQGAQTGGA